VEKKNNNKACGVDLVINEYNRSTAEKFIELYEKLFNLIFQSGQTVSNAFAKSTNAQYNFFFLFFKILKRE
jgi:hypothetical protein